MSSNQSNNQKQELFKSIWKIADALRGKVDGWEFKQYVFCFLFYRYISQDITNYINRGEHQSDNEDFDYEKCIDEDITEEIKNELINEKGYFIYPSQLFNNILKNKKNDDDLNIIVANVFKSIESSAIGASSENDLKGLFDGLDLNSPKIGETVIARNKKIVEIMQAIHDINFGNIEDNVIDVFGDAYEYLMGLYASDAGKSGGEYFTPQEVSELLTKLAIGNKQEINKVYDPACGSGSLLLKANKILGKNKVKKGFYGQESNITTFNLCRINMFLHGINYYKFNIAFGDTLINPKHNDDRYFDVIVSNPPYSIKWEGDNNPILINDERFAPAGVLAPKSRADMAFIMHCLNYLSVDGKAAIVCFPGIFYRRGAEQKIRKYLIDNNYVDLIIALPASLFYEITITTDILVLSKNKSDTKTMFIDASDEFIKTANQNQLCNKNINKIVETYLDRKEIKHFSILVDCEKIKSNNYDLSVNNYVNAEDAKPKELIDIKQLNASIDEIVKRNDELRKEINKIIKDLDNE